MDIHIHTYLHTYIQAAALKEEWEQKKKTSSSAQPPSAASNAAAELDTDVITGSAAGDESVIG